MVESHGHNIEENNIHTSTYCLLSLNKAQKQKQLIHDDRNQWLPLEGEINIEERAARETLR